MKQVLLDAQTVEQQQLKKLVSDFTLIADQQEELKRQLLKNHKVAVHCSGH